jgi:hypothetical protein
VTTTDDVGVGAPKLAPIAPFRPIAPDTDFEDARSRMQNALVIAAPAWTDFNATDPGITTMEALAFGLADIHYRIASAGLDAWPAQWPGWLDEADRHWRSVLPAPSAAGELGAVANALRDLLALPGRDVEREVAACAERADAEALLARPPFSDIAPAATRSPIVTALRWRQLRRVALERTDVIADAVDSADRSSATAIDADSRAADELELVTELWREECEALVRRERRRRLAESLDVPLAADSPEDLELPGGESRVWPPHPVQALPCEPVTADDYAARARSHPGVKRAWAVRGRLEGIAWNGLPTTTDTAAEALSAGDPRLYLRPDANAEALTIIVETTASDPDDGELRGILAHSVGTEPFNPYNTWRNPPIANEPRRLTCDEVGIAPLRVSLVRVSATLLIPPTANRAQVKNAATAAIDEYLDRGRDANTASPELAPPWTDGPWPPAPQPTLGWIPGESIRLSEVVARVVDIPEVIAVRDLQMRREDSSTWASGANGVLVIPVGHVPRRSVYECFATEFLVDGGCDA